MTSKTAKINFIPHLPWTQYTVLIMSMALEVMKLIFAVLDVINSGYYTVIIKHFCTLIFAVFHHIYLHAREDRKVKI